MNSIKVASLTALLLAASISNYASASSCIVSGQVVKFASDKVHAGDTVQLDYSASRQSCSGAGTFGHKVTVGSPKGLELGQCEGVRTADSEVCSSSFALPAGFVGDLSVHIAGMTQKLIVLPAIVVPVVEDKAVVTDEDSEIVIDLATAGETYPHYEVYGQPLESSGSAKIVGSTVVFTPVSNWNGQASFTYKATDVKGIQSGTGTVTVDVLPVPDAPVMVTSVLMGNEDRPAKFKPLVNDVDLGDSYFISVVSQPAGGVGVVTVDGHEVTFTPAANWFGETEFTLKATDSFGLASEVQYYKAIFVNEVDAPIVTPVTRDSLEDEIVQLTVEYDDVDGSSPYTIFISKQPGAGGVCTVANTDVVFNPAQDWSGVAVCEVSVSDAAGGVGHAEFKFNVQPVNDSPVVKNQDLTITQGGSATASIAITDPDLNETHAITLVDPADSAFGLVTVVAGGIRVTPAPAFYGTRKIAFKVVDTSGASSEVAYLHTKVLPANTAPQLLGQSFVVGKNTSFEFRVGAIDANGDSPLKYTVSTQPVSGGTVTISDDIATYVPAAGFVGAATVSIVATDPAGMASAPAVFTFNVKDATVVAVDPDIEDSHTLVIVEHPPAAVGKLSVVGSKVVLEPAKGYFGTATFKYKIVDAFAAETAVTVGQIQVDKYNYAPDSSSAAISVIEGKVSLPVTPTVADENPYDLAKHKFIVPIQNTKGFVEVVNNQLVYTASFGFSGVETFNYLAVDPGGLSVVGTATVTVQPLNYAPSSVKGRGNGFEGSPVVAPIIVEDKNPADTHTFAVIEQHLSGVVTIVDGVATFTPEHGFVGVATVPVRATDAAGLFVDGYLTFTVEKISHAPTALSGHIVTYENAQSAAYYPQIVDQNSYDLGKHVIAIAVQGANGTAEVVDNRIIYTPAPHYSGPDVIRVTATDLAGGAVEGEVTVTVIQHNNAPVQTEVKIYAFEGIPSDPVVPTVVDFNAWDSHTFEIISQPSHGQVENTPEGFVYTPGGKYYGLDEFRYRAVDSLGEYVEAIGKVVVYKFNYAPTGFSPAEFQFYEGVGGDFKLSPIDKNLWGTYVFTVEQQPAHGEAWFDGYSLVYRTHGTTQVEVLVKVTDQGGESFTGVVTLKPRPLSDLIDGLPVVDLPDHQVRTPAITKPFFRTNGMPGFVIQDKDALLALGTELIAVVDAGSEVGLQLSGVNVSPARGTRLSVDFLSGDAIGTAIAAFEPEKGGLSFVKVARVDGTGSVYRVPVEVWTPKAELSLDANPAIQLVDRVRGLLQPVDNQCKFLTKEIQAQKGNPYDLPYCFVEFTKRPAETRLVSSETSLAFEGAVEQVGEHDVEAAAYIIGADGEKNLLATYSNKLNVLAAAGAVTIGPRNPFAEAFFKVESLDVEMKQLTGPTCDLTIVDIRAKNAAANFSSRPTCLIEWAEIPIGLAVRPNWERPYLMGTSEYLGENSVKWNMFIYSSTGTKVAVGSGTHDFVSVMPPDIKVDYAANSNKLSDTLYKSYLSGQYVVDATIASAGAQLKIRHNFFEGEIQEETILAGYVREQLTRRRIYTAPYERLWQVRDIFVEAGYGAIPSMSTNGNIQVVSVPDQGILPVLDTLNQKVLSTDNLQVSASIADNFDTTIPYDDLRMGEWDIRLVTKASMNKIEPLSDWIKNGADGKSAFDVPLDELAGKTLRVYAEARPISPIPEYTQTRMSPRALSIAILNGEAIDGSVRALRMTGEAPLRVTLFADVTNRAWTRDLGAVKWEISTEGGPWVEEVNPSRAFQRLSKTFQKGNYKVRAHLVNKHSGATTVTEEIEIVAYNVPVGRMKGPGNTFVESAAEFKLLKTNGAPQDISDMDVEWSLDRGETWEPGGDKFSIKRDTEQRVYVYSRMKFKDAPIGDPRVWRTFRSGVAFRKVRPPRVQIIGPRRPEVGVESTWIANLMMPYPGMDLTMGGEFIMPSDGAIVPGETVKYTPTDADLDLEKTVLSYRAWINGYRDKGGEGVTDQRITFWLYDWPAWAIQPTMSSDYAPADLTLRVRNIGEFKNVEGVFYDWELPVHPGISIIKDDNMALRLMKVLEPAEYVFKVHVYDARGNYSVVEKPLVFKQPPPWTVSLVWSGSNTANRAPMDVLVRPHISGGHPKDAITSMVYRLDGEEISTGGSRYARAKLQTQGAYKISLGVESKMGKAASGEVDVEVKTNVPPTCSVSAKETSAAWTLTAACVDEDGRIGRHHWYLNETLQGLGGSVITISKRTYSEPPKVVLVAVDDSGEESPAVAW